MNSSSLSYQNCRTNDSTRPFNIYQEILPSLMQVNKNEEFFKESGEVCWRVTDFERRSLEGAKFVERQREGYVYNSLGFQ